MKTLETIAASLNIDVAILRQVYENGYSDGWDEATEMLTSEMNKPDYYDIFFTEKQNGQRE